MTRKLRLVETRPSGAGRARGLVSSRKSGRRVAARSYAPPDALADIVATLWAGSWDLRGQAPHTTERVPDPCCNLVFEIGNMPGSRLVGPWTKLWRRTLEGAGHVRGVKLRPGALRAIVPRPAHAFAERSPAPAPLPRARRRHAQARDSHCAPAGSGGAHRARHRHSSRAPRRRPRLHRPGAHGARLQIHHGQEPERLRAQPPRLEPTTASRAALSSSRRTRRR
jgi:hypothetical protein